MKKIMAMLLWLSIWAHSAPTPAVVPAKNAQTQLTSAVVQHDSSLVRSLLEGQAPDINKLDGNGLSPLMYAAENGYVSILKQLLAYGAQVNQQSVQQGFTPLMFAIQFMQVPAVRFLLENVDDIDLNIKNFSGKSSIMMAAQRAVDYAKEAREAQKEHREQDERYATAQRNVFLKIIRMLIDGGAEKDDLYAYSFDSDILKITFEKILANPHETAAIHTWLELLDERQNTPTPAKKEQQSEEPKELETIQEDVLLPHDQSEEFYDRDYEYPN